jgi:hypothetical protein
MGVEAEGLSTTTRFDASPPSRRLPRRPCRAGTPAAVAGPAEQETVECQLRRSRLVNGPGDSALLGLAAPAQAARDTHDHAVAAAVATPAGGGCDHVFLLANLSQLIQLCVHHLESPCITDETLSLVI